MEFDTFESVGEMKPESFIFKPNRFELWQNQKIIKSGSTFNEIEAIYNNSVIQIEIKDISLHSIINPYTEYDKLVSTNDRLRFIKIPTRTNLSSNGFEALKFSFGPTRKDYLFEENEPYCCNIFLKFGRLAKLSFSYGSPVKLLEFYSETINETFFKFRINEINFLELSDLKSDKFEDYKICITDDIIDYVKKLINKAVSEFGANKIKNNLIRWQDDDFIQFLSITFEIGAPFIILNSGGMLVDFKNENNLERLVCYINNALSRLLSNIFYDLNLKENNNHFYLLSELATFSNRAIDLLFESDVEKKVFFLYDYYIDNNEDD